MREDRDSDDDDDDDDDNDDNIPPVSFLAWLTLPRFLVWRSHWDNVPEQKWNLMGTKIIMTMIDYNNDANDKKPWKKRHLAPSVA